MSDEWLDILNDQKYYADLEIEQQKFLLEKAQVDNYLRNLQDVELD